MAKVERHLVETVDAHILIKDGESLERAKSTVERTSGSTWAQTMLIIEQGKDDFSFDLTKDQKKLAEDIRDAFKTAFRALAGESAFDGNGYNARKKRQMPIRDTKGEPKWASWGATRAPMIYCSDLARYLKNGLKPEDIIEENNDEDGNLESFGVLSKSAMADKTKASESPLETIKRSSEMIDKKGPELEASDIEDAIALVKASLKALETLKA